MKTIKINLHKFILFGMILLSFCLVFAGCNLTTSTPAQESVSVTPIQLDAPNLAQGLVAITQEEYFAIPFKERPDLYNESGTQLNKNSVNWSNTNYIYSPFKDQKKGSFKLSIYDPNTNDTRGFIFGVAEENPYTTGTTVDYSKFTQIKVLDNVNSSVDVYSTADVAGFITEPQTYYFYVKALGVGYRVDNGQKKNYLDSNYSNIYTYTHLSSLKEEFSLENDGHKITWENLPNSEGYEVYVNDSLYTKTTTNSCDLDNVAGKTFPLGEVKVYVKALGKSYYVGSKSEEIKITNTINLSAPANFSVNESFVATWDAVSNAQGYELNLVDPSGTSETITTTNSSFSLVSRTTKVGKYYIQIKAVGNDTTTFSSLYTPFISFEKFEKLRAPSGAKSSLTGQSLELSWTNDDENAQSYSIYLDYESVKVSGRSDRTDEVSGITLIHDYCTSTTYTLPIFDIVRDLKLRGILGDNEKFASFDILVKANGYGYYTDSDFSKITVNNITLSAPQDLKQLGSNIVWSNNIEADYYLVYFKDNVNDTTSSAIKVNDTYVKTSKLNLISNDNTIYVQAISNIYLDSQTSSINYLITSLLSAPKQITLVENGGSISLTWDNVENAQTYSVYLDLSSSEVMDGEEPLSEVILLNDGVEAKSETTFNIDLSSVQEQLREKGIENPKLKTYCFYVITNAYDTFKESVKTVVVYKNKKLNDPVLSESQFNLSWNTIQSADYYDVYLDDEIIAQGITSTLINIEEHLINSGVYNFSVQAKSNIYLDSNLVNHTITYSKGQLASPQLTIVNEVLTWESVEGANYYELYINGEIIENNLTATQYDLTVSCVEYGTYTIGVRAMSRLDPPSNISEIVYRKTDVSVLEITSVTNSTIEFTNVGHAQTFDIYLNNTLIDSVSPTENSYINYNYLGALNSFKQSYAGEAVVISVAAKDAQNNTTDISNSKFVYKQNADAYEFYYIFDCYYDNIIENYNEFVNACLYNLIFECEMNLIIEYTNNIINEFNLAFADACKYLTTYKYDTVASTAGNVLTLSINNAYAPTYSTGYTSNEDDPLWQNYVPQNVRGNGNFVTDNYIISADIKNSDQLLWAILFSMRPTFSEGSESIEAIYNTAKNILNSILPQNATDYEKALIIAEYICANCSYDQYFDDVSADNKYNTKFHFLEGFFEDGLVVCDGYAKTFALLCNMENIKTYVVSGDRNGSAQGGEHAWNKIYLDLDASSSNYSPSWFAVDLTDCDGLLSSNNTQMFSHNRFLLADDDSRMGDRVIYSDFYPTCNTSFDYYYSNLNKLGVYLHNSKYNGSGQTQIENMMEAILTSMQENNQVSIDFAISQSSLTNLTSAINNVLNKLNISASKLNLQRTTLSSSDYLILLTYNLN